MLILISVFRCVRYTIAKAATASVQASAPVFTQGEAQHAASLTAATAAIRQLIASCSKAACALNSACATQCPASTVYLTFLQEQQPSIGEKHSSSEDASQESPAILSSTREHNHGVLPRAPREMTNTK
jgi:hypothetical protein